LLKSQFGAMSQARGSSTTKEMAPEVLKHLSSQMIESITPRALLTPRFTRIIVSSAFDQCILLIILFNCVTMGVEAENLLGKAQVLEKSVLYLEHFFTVVFLGEILGKAFVYGIHTFMPFRQGGSIMNFLDAMLVFSTGVVSVWILPLAGVDGGAALRLLSTLRALRLFRLVRILKGSVAFKDIWLLLQGIIESARTLLWTLVVIFFITFMFSVFGVVLISTRLQELIANGEHNDEQLERLYKLVNGIGNFMFLLVQVLTLDSWASEVRPLMDYIGWAWVFFLTYIAIACLVLMNLVTAVIVENALQASKKNEEMQVALTELDKQKAQRDLKELFTKIDTDGSGYLSRKEFFDCFDDEEVGPKMRVLGCSLDQASEVFELMSEFAAEDQEPEIHTDGFLGNFGKLQGPATSREIFQTRKQLEAITRHITVMLSKIAPPDGAAGRTTQVLDILAKKEMPGDSIDARILAVPTHCAPCATREVAEWNQDVAARESAENQLQLQVLEPHLVLAQAAEVGCQILAEKGLPHLRSMRVEIDELPHLLESSRSAASALRELEQQVQGLRDSIEKKIVVSLETVCQKMDARLGQTSQLALPAVNGHALASFPGRLPSNAPNQQRGPQATQCCYIVQAV